MKTSKNYTTSRVLCTLFIIIWVTINLSGQNTGVYKKLYYSIYLSNSGTTDFLKDKKVHKSTLKSLRNFYSDKRARSRSRAYSLARNIYNNSEDKVIKECVVQDHLEACLEDRSPSLRYQLANHLIQFKSEDFNEKSIGLMKELIKNDANKRQYIVVAGYKGMEEVLPDITTFSDKEIVESFDIIQAMARVGKPEAIEICRRLVKEHPLDINFFDKLLPGLVFTNDRLIFDAIISELLDDNTELIGGRLKDYQRYYMLKYITPLIYEYPYRFVDESQLTEDEFYQQLHFAVDWMQNNKEEYTLISIDSPLKSKRSPYLSTELTTSDY